MSDSTKKPDDRTELPPVEKAVAVRFTRHMSPYNAGEVAGFAADRAERLIRQGYGIRHVDAKPEPKKA